MTTPGLGAAEEGCLLLADITGYTKYLQEAELEHAEDVLADLLSTLVDTLEPTFTFTKLEGDAAFAHAPLTRLTPTLVMDTVEAGYFAFRRRLRDITHATTCQCNACILIPDLDLKYFIHEGRYVVRTIARNLELTGPDVVLVHRLLKGSAGAAVSKRGYAVYTATTLERFAMDPEMLGFVPHTEAFEDVGEVTVFVQDLDRRWAFEQERNRRFVPPDGAVYEREVMVAAPPVLVWDHLTDPSKRLLWQIGVDEVVMTTPGRLGPGAVNHCMHGDVAIVEKVADWRPFRYVTLEYDFAVAEQPVPFTYELLPEGDGTRLQLRIGDLGPERMGFWPSFETEWSPVFERQLENLRLLFA